MENLELKPGMSEDDYEFLRCAQEIDLESEANQFGNSSNGTLAEYQDINYVSLISKKPVILRAVGKTPIPIAKFKEGDDPSVAIEVYSCEVMGKEKKNCKLILPDRNQDASSEHVLWKLVDVVLAYDIVDGKRVYRYQNGADAYKRVFDHVFTGGFENGKQFSKGLRGQKIIIQNVIDRSDPEWHKKNQSTKLLAKSCWPIASKPGTFGYQLGIPSFGYTNAWGEMWKAYGNWEKYDVAITRTGLTSPPVTIKNASKFKEAGIPEIPAELLPLVVVGPLTEEERNYKKVECARLFGISAYGKILARLTGLLQETDNVFHTHFFEEIKEKAVEEKKKNPQKAEFDEETSTAVDAATKIQTQGTTFTAVEVANKEVPVQPTVSRRTSVSAESSPTESLINTKLLKGWNNLTQEEKDCVVKTVEVDGVLQSIEYKPSPNHPDAPLLDCNLCSGFSPDWFNRCPKCGAQFSFE